VENIPLGNNVTDKPQSRLDRLSGLIGIIAIILANIAAIVTHIEELKQKIAGWWPNSSVDVRNNSDYFAGLTAQVLYVLARAQAVIQTLRSDHRINDAIRNYFLLGIDGAEGFEMFSTRKADVNEQVEASDRYFEGRSETIEQNTFLWYPWATVLASEINFSAFPDQAEKSLADRLLNRLLSRSDDDASFVSSFQAIFPTAESLFALEKYLNNINMRTQKYQNTY
jgi:hypothetical protein